MLQIFIKSKVLLFDGTCCDGCGKPYIKGEIMKFAVIGVLFFVAITNFQFQLMPLLIGFIATLLAFWVALLTSFK